MDWRSLDSDLDPAKSIDIFGSVVLDSTGDMPAPATLPSGVVAGVEEGLDFHIEGSAAINIADGKAVIVASGTPGVSIDMGKGYTTTGQSNGSGSITFDRADVFRLTVSDASVYFGKGGAILDPEMDSENAMLTRTQRYSDDNAGPDPAKVISKDAVGFWGELTGTLDMVSILDLGADHKEGGTGADLDLGSLGLVISGGLGGEFVGYEDKVTIRLWNGALKYNSVDPEFLPWPDNTFRGRR